MKLKELENKLISIADCLSIAWHTEQIKQPYSSFYLWSRTAREGETIAIPIISQDQPSDEYTLQEMISNGWTKEKAKIQIINIMRKLPILGE